MIKYPEISFVSIYGTREPESSYFYRFLFNLLSQRTPEENISHRKMPSYYEHIAFVQSEPYKEWYIIQNVKGVPVGSIYVTYQNEIGIFIEQLYRGDGYASAALYGIITLNPDTKFLANINPENEKSKALFEKFGFTYIQNTYRRDPNVSFEQPFENLETSEQSPQT